jgi:hypothetical protein
MLIALTAILILKTKRYVMCSPFGTAMDMEIHKCEIVSEIAGEG